jgi:hypothetical protein
MSELSPRELDVILRSDLGYFAERCFYQLNPQAAFLTNWHIEVIAAKLAAVREGKIQRLIINLPPRHLKSLMASIAFPAWCLGHDPSAQILCVSYAQDLADKLARDCRGIMMSPWYRRIFPTRLAPHRHAVQEFITTRQGYRLATSTGGVLTGRGADLILIDDPSKPEEALSDARRNATNEWFLNTLYSRLNDKCRGAIVIIMQRLHEDDLVGHVLGQEPWEVVCFPAIAEADEVHEIDTIWGPQFFTRRPGEALHPARESLATLAHIRRTIGEYNFAGQYQQSPAPLGGGLVKTEWFRRYSEKDRPESFERIVQSWDTANKAAELSDFCGVYHHDLHGAIRAPFQRRRCEGVHAGDALGERRAPAQCPPLFCAVRIANSIPLPRACSRSASKPAGARCRRRPKQRCLPTLPGQAANSGRRRSPCVDVALALVEDVRGRYPIPVQAVACAAGDVA